MIPYSIQIRGRTYRVQPFTGRGVDGNESGYYLDGVRGASYGTMRNKPNPHLMFLVNSRTLKVLDGVWLSDEGGTLKVVKQ